MMTEYELHPGHFESETLPDELPWGIIPSVFKMAVDDAMLSLRGAAEKLSIKLI